MLNLSHPEFDLNPNERPGKRTIIYVSSVMNPGGWVRGAPQNGKKCEKMVFFTALFDMRAKQSHQYRKFLNFFPQWEILGNFRVDEQKKKKLINFKHI